MPKDGQALFNKRVGTPEEEGVSGEPMTNEAPEPETFPEERRTALVSALRDRFDMAADDAQEIADTIAEVFAGSEEVSDESLDPSVRSIFYTLEAKKILSFRREEYTWETGEKRRGFWWRVREGELAKVKTLVPEGPEEDVYANLPKDAWTARQHA